MKEKSLDNSVTKKCIHNEGLNAPYETILGYGSCANGPYISSISPLCMDIQTWAYS